MSRKLFLKAGRIWRTQFETVQWRYSKCNHYTRIVRDYQGRKG